MGCEVMIVVYKYKVWGSFQSSPFLLRNYSDVENARIAVEFCKFIEQNIGFMQPTTRMDRAHH